MVYLGLAGCVAQTAAWRPAARLFVASIRVVHRAASDVTHSTGTVHAFYGKQLNLGISLTAFPPVAIQAHWAEARFYYSRRHECASLLSTMEVHGVRNLTTTDAGVRWFFHAFPNFLLFLLSYTNLFIRPYSTYCIVAACCYIRRTFRGLCVGHTREPWSWSRVGPR